jgi:hypothetical protein
VGERSDPPVVPLRLVLEAGETVEVDGSSVYDPSGERPTPAVVLRMPAHRAAWFGGVLNAHAGICRLAGAELTAAERGPAWALAKASKAAGHEEPATIEASHVTSARRMAAAAVLRAAEDLDDVATIAVVDAAARWLEEPGGDEYAYALLGAVTDGPTQVRAYGALLGTGGAP